MPGKNPRLTPLQSRKQLLIAESELNRAQFVEEWESVAGGVHAAADRAKSFAAIASSAAVLVAALTAFRRRKPAPVEAKPSWLRAILKAARLVTTVWLAFRSPGARPRLN
jgi:hypothetical protein